MPKLKASEIAVLCFTFGYLLIWLFAAVKLGNHEFIMYFGVMCVLVVAVGLLYFRIRFHVVALWGLAVWGLAHMAGGLLYLPESWPHAGESTVLYNFWLIPGLLKYDQIVHAYGFGLTTWICWMALATAFASHGVTVQPTAGLLALCLAAGMGFGAANEVVEFAATLLIPGTNVGGYENTGWDLVANFCGCLFAATLIYFLQKGK
jgi:uncharacterized membrane protein